MTNLSQYLQYPFLVGMNYVKFLALTLMSKANPLFPQQRTERFARSAAKRDPVFVTLDNISKIMTSTTFEPSFCLGKRGLAVSRAGATMSYLSRMHSGVDPRKPEPGFHPHIFANEGPYHDTAESDPYVGFLNSGRADGPWSHTVIHGGTEATPEFTPITLSSALHIHAYYVDQLAEIVGRLAFNRHRPDLFISVRSNEDAATARDMVSDYGDKICKIAVFPNAGRDIGAFLTGFCPKLVRDYDVIGHLHTKKSPFNDNSAWVDNWVNYVLSNLLGSVRAGAMADRILGAMQADAQIGIVYPEDPHIPGWGSNRNEAERLSTRLGVDPLPEAFNFPIGTMFWMRSGALKPFVDLGLSWDDYPAEPIPNDGTMLHGLERLFGVVPAQSGWKTVLTHTSGVTR